MATTQAPLSSQQFAQQVLKDFPPKQMALRILNNLPDDVSYEEIMYHLYTAEKVNDGLQDVARGETYSMEEVEQMFEQSLKAAQVPATNG